MGLQESGVSPSYAKASEDGSQESEGKADSVVAEFTLSNAEGLRMTARRAVNPSRDCEG